MALVRMSRAATFFLTLRCCSLASGQGFLKHDPSASRLGGMAGLDAEFQQAMTSVMGCRASPHATAAEKRLATVEAAISPMWRVLPKNDHGRVEWRMLRYLAHRYFLKQSSLLIRGLEPVRQVNDSHAGTAQIMDERASSLTDAALQGKRTSTGFTFEDAVALVATMEQLIWDSESVLLEEVYKDRQMATTGRLTRKELHALLETYVVHWFYGPATTATYKLSRNAPLREKHIPHWRSISGFLDGVIKSMEFSHRRVVQVGDGHAAMSSTYDFDHAHRAVGAVTATFASYWEAECQKIKTALMTLDKTHTGRVKLSDFYGANADGEWHFAESENYLRELGALDEASTWTGKQVIIPNYLQGASNCIVTAKHYYVCCVNECESVLDDLEEAVGAPVAEPETILRPLASMTTYDDEPLKLTDTLKTQLQMIASTHGGKVPLHGRLFAQWLHYVFPHECPFPHKAGTHSAMGPSEYGSGSRASHTEVAEHVAIRDQKTEQEVLEEAQWMSQWSEEEEELFADYSMELRAPWAKTPSTFVVASGFALVLLATLSAFGLSSKSAAIAFECHGTIHFV